MLSVNNESFLGTITVGPADNLIGAGLSDFRGREVQLEQQYYVATLHYYVQ